MLGPKNQRRGGIEALCLSLVTLPFAACGTGKPSESGMTLHPVAGRVTVDGRPASGVEVRLYPLNQGGDAAAIRPTGTTDKEGRFRLAAGDGREGAPDGQYITTLVWPGPGGADRLHGAFAEPDGSGLTAVIEGSTSELPAFEIDGGVARKGKPR